ncbi:MAG: peptidoglycan editing factor PgeF [Alphaproteobacteria bacterium]|nr:peptidoglycan editing factor PgeF [Alphaproteobacteria bacterium]
MQYLKDSSFPNDKVFHGFFTRQGGVSKTPYGSLNCGIGSNDLDDNIRENRVRVAREAHVEEVSLLSVYQVHSADVVHVNQGWGWDNRPQADAMVTDQKGFGLGILTADCGPVLFYGEKQNGDPVVGAAHAGWKGALFGVLENTVSKMIDLGADANTIQVCVGPCIGKASYEVSANFSDPFLNHSEESDRFFSAAAKEGCAMFDLAGYCAWRLSLAGVKNITLMDKDTYVLEDQFYSYRRMTHRGEADYGRQISVICVK